MWPFVYLLTLSLLGMKADAACGVKFETNLTEIYSTFKLNVTSTLASLENVTVEMVYGDGEMIFIDSVPVEVNATVSKTVDVFFTKPGFYKLKAICEDLTYSNSTEIEVGELSLTHSGQNPDNISSLFVFTLTFNHGLQVNTDYNCTLSLLNSSNSDHSDKLEGTKEVEAVGDVCSFSNLRVKNKGSYKLSVFIYIHSDTQTGNTTQTYEASGFTVTSSISSISLAIGSTVDAYKDLSQVLTVKGDSGVDYLDGYSVLLTMSDGSDVITTGSLTDIETATKTLNFYLKTSGSAILTVNVTSADNSDSLVEDYNLTVNPAIFVLSNIDNSTSKDDFPIQIEIKTASSNSISSSKLGTFTLDLELSGTDNSGNKFLVGSTPYNSEYSADFSTNIINLSSVTILSSGSFEFKVASSDLFVLNKTSNIFNITNDIKTLTHSTPTPSNFFDFNITFEVFGDDDEYYLDLANITIEETSSLGLNGALSIETSTGQAIVENLYFEQSGAATLNYSVGALQLQDDFTVSKSLLIFETIEYPQNSSTYFNVSVNVKNSDSTLIDSTYNHTVTLGLLPQFNNSGSIIEGELSLTGKSPFMFTNLRILSSGNFTLNATSEYLTEAESEEFEITNSVKNITIEVEQDKTIYFNFNVTINIFGDDDNHYLGECDITLKDSNDNSLVSLFTNNGSVSVSIYLTNSTATRLETSCGGVTGYSEIFTPVPLKFEIEIFNETDDIISETDATRTVYAVIKVVDENGVVEETNYNSGVYPFYLKLVNNTEEFSGLAVYFDGSSALTTNGEFSGSTEGGVANVSLKILSSGEFKLEVWSDPHPNITSNEANLNVVNFFVNYSVGIESTTVYLPTDFEIILYGNDGNKFILPMNATIIDQSDSSNNYTCENNMGHCKISDLVLTQKGNNVFGSSELEDNFSIEGKAIKISVAELNNTAVKTSRDEFELITSLNDNNHTNIITHSTPNACSLTLSIIAFGTSAHSGEVLAADSLTNSSSNGELNFTSINILSSGVFTLAINTSCEYIDDWESDYQLTIYNYPKNLSLSYNPDVTIYNYFSVSTIVQGDDDNDYLGECNFTISENLKSQDLTEIYEGNSTNLSLYIDKIGDIAASVACTSYDVSVNETIELEASKQQLKIEFVGGEPSTSDPFNLTVKIQDKDGVELNSSNSFAIEHQIFLSLYDSGDDTDKSGESFSGDLNKNISNYAAEFTDLQILSSGFFKIIANSSEYDFVEPDTSDELDIENEVSNFNCTFSGPQSTYFNFNLTITPIGEDSNTYLLDTNYTLHTTDDSLQGTLEVNDTTGKGHFSNLYFTKSGKKMIHINLKGASEEISGTCKVEIFKSNLIIESFIHPNTSDDTFSLIVKVVDRNDSNNEETNNGPYNVSLSLIANESSPYSGNKLLGNNELFVESGLLNFTDLRVMSYGTFKVRAIAKQNLNSAETEEFSVVNTLKTLNISVNPSTSTFKNLRVEASVIGADDNLFIPNTNVSISTNGTEIVIANTTNDTENSLVEFTLYSKRAESVRITLSTEWAGNSSTFDVDTVFYPASFEVSDNSIPKYANQSFFIEYFIYDNQDTNKKVLTNAHEVEVKLNFTCNDKDTLQKCSEFSFNGNDLLNTTQGTVNFTDLKIMSASKIYANIEALNADIDYFSFGEYNIIQKPYFEMNFLNTPTNSLNEFDIQVFVFYEDSKAYKDVEFSLDFSSVNDTDLSGELLVFSSSSNLSNTFISNSSGYYVLEGLKILSSGYFKFDLYYDGELKTTLETGFVNNYVSDISLNCDSQVYINFPLVVEYNLKGSDDNPYIIDADLEISEDNGYDIDGELEQTLFKGSFDISLTQNKTYTLNVTSNKSGAFETCKVNAFKNTLDLSSSIDSKTFINNSESIEFTGTIFGKDKKDIENENGKYTITILLTNSGKASEVNLVSKSGIISSSIPIRTPGSYSLTIKSHPQLITNFTETIQIVETLEKFSYNSSNLTQAVNTLIVFPVQLYGYSGSLYTNETNITLACDDGMIIEQNSFITNTGEATFRLYSDQKGSNVCSIKAIDYSISEFITFTTNNDRGIADELCYIEYNPTDCYICIENSRENIDGNCTCADHSTYNSSTVECICDDGYNSSNSYCIVCGYFYEASEVSAYYSVFYDSIVIEFGRKGENTEINCSEAFTIPGSLSEFVTECEWVAEDSIAIFFNETVPGVEFELVIDPLLIQHKSKGACDYNVEELNIPVKRKFQKPTPVTTLFAPSEVSASCGLSDVNIYTTTFDSSYIYQWSSDDSILDDLLSNENGTSVSINVSLLIKPTYEITLKVTNSIFKTSDSKSTTLKVSESKVISVGFTVGSSFNYKVSEALPLKAGILDACGESGFTFDYILTEDSKSNPDLLELIKTNSPSLLNIRPGYFTGGKKYTISVTVQSSNSINGTATLNIEAQSSDIIVGLSYSDGIISTLFDLEIEASAIDPDDLTNNKFTYEWSCTYNSGVCKDNSGKNLIDDKNSETIKIDKSRLKDETDYLFKVTVSSPGKTSQSAEVELFASSSVTGLIRLAPINEVVNSNSVLLLLPYIDIKKGVKVVEWEISPSISGVDLKKEFLLIPRNSLESGQSYIITVYLGAKGSADDTRATSAITVSVNAPPECEGFSTEYIEKNMLLLTASNCQDSDSDSYILYQFGYKKETKYFWLSRLIFEQTSMLRLPQADKAAVRVCDKSLSCIIYESDIPNESRLLKVNITEYNEDTSDFDQIPSSVAYYSEFIESHDEFDELFNDHKFYFNSIDIDDNSFDLFVNVHSTLITNALTTIDLDRTTSSEVVELILNITNSYAQSISKSNFEELVKIIGKFSDSLEIQVITDAIDAISSYAMKETVLDMYIGNEVGNLKYYRTRMAGSDIFNSSLVAANLTVMFKDDLNIKEDGVYDIVLMKFIQDDSIFEITFKETGSVANGLDLYATAEDQNIISTSGIQVEYFDSFDTDDDYECVYLDSNLTWQEGGCEVNSISSDSVSLTLEHLTVFSIIRSTGSDDCDTGAGPISTMCVLIFLIIVASIVFTIVDKSVKFYPNVHRLILLYPLTSLFYKQAFIRRTVIAVQILTSELLLLTFIGAFHHHWDDTNDETDNSFDDFYGRQLRRGAAGWALTQVFTIPIFILNAYMLHYKKTHYVTLPICGFFIVGSFIGIIVMTTYYCQGWTEYWISNWLIFFFLDLLTLEIIYSVIMMFFVNQEIYTKDEKSVHKENEYNLAPTSRRGEDDYIAEPVSSNYDIVYEGSNN